MIDSMLVTREFAFRCCNCKHAGLFVFLLALLFGGMFFSLGFVVGMGKSPKQGEYVYYPKQFLSRNRPDQRDLLQTQEFQVRINKQRYSDRLEAVETLTQYLREITGLTLKENEASIKIYEETQLDTSSCGHQFSELRRRVFYDSRGIIQSNKTTIDINEDSIGHDINTALAWDLGASSKYKSEDKIETDIHSSHYKYNRKTKVKNLPTDFTISSCGDIEEMFPYAFQHPINTEKQVKSSGKIYYIWEYSFSGKMFYDTTKFKFSWTLYYTSLENALNLTLAPEHQPEFSIRIYSPGDGLAPWYVEAIQYAADLYQKVLIFDANM